MVRTENWKDLKCKSEKICSTKIATGLSIKWFYIPHKILILVKVIFSHSPKSSKGLPNCCVPVEAFKTCMWHWLCTAIHTYIRGGQNVKLEVVIPLLMFQHLFCFLMKSLGLLWLNLLHSENFFPKKRTRNELGILVFKWIVSALKFI